MHNYRPKLYVFLLTLFLTVFIWNKNSVLATHNNNAKNNQNHVLHSTLFKSRTLFDNLGITGKSPMIIGNIDMASAKLSSKAFLHIAKSQPVLSARDKIVFSNKQLETSNNFLAGESQNFTWVYINEYNTNRVIGCLLKNNEIFDCKTVLDNFSGAENVTIVKDEMFVLNFSPPYIRSCTIGKNGAIQSCTNFPLAIPEMTSMFYNNYSLYLMNFSDTIALECDLDNNLQITGCNNIDITSTKNLLQLNTYYKNNTYLIITDNKTWSRSIIKCGESTCTNISDPNINTPNSILIRNDIAYITNFNTNTLVQCKILDNGDFAPCQILASGLNAPTNIAIYSAQAQK